LRFDQPVFAAKWAAWFLGKVRIFLRRFLRGFYEAGGEFEVVWMCEFGSLMSLGGIVKGVASRKRPTSKKKRDWKVALHRPDLIPDVTWSRRLLVML
jgi:hypothetical protein